MRQLCRGRVLGISVAIAHGVFSGSLNILLKFLISRYQFSFLTLVQCLTSSTAALSLELLRRLGLIAVPPFGLSLARSFAGVAVLSTLQSSLTLWSLRGLSLPMYVVFKRCLPLVTMLIGVLVLKNGAPSPGVLAAVLITTCGAALAAPSSGGMESRQRRELESSPALSRKEGGRELPRITRGWGAGETGVKPEQPGLSTRALGKRNRPGAQGQEGRGGPPGNPAAGRGETLFPGPCPHSVEAASWGSLSLPVPTGREPPSQVASVQASGTPRSLPREHLISPWPSPWLEEDRVH
ncbi:solute carrier family 35 member D3 isoform X1 [Mus musculus]|uniref:solute carrier family 35 member D3 isoform X1 n=1 Tax=Mus musculus TaxID=10090 RepID=UPI0003D78FA8|nr:solute carrier family 35 member D3 isoform X1 [Mus musculus]|eukprot:XP_006512979.1 PREDICTED: solute carrier family 35 member D3 isoform X1 [Mus musculus]